MIKAKTITTDKATLLVRELPEGSRDIVVTTFNRIGFYLPNGISSYEMLPEGNWQLLGRLPEITEERADGSVEKVVFEDEEFGDIIKYRDYTGIPIGRYNKCYAPITALESLYSLLQANEVYFENKYGKEKPTKISYIGNILEMEAKSALALHQMRWKAAQSKVWDKEQTYIFIKVD